LQIALTIVLVLLVWSLPIKLVQLLIRRVVLMADAWFARSLVEKPDQNDPTCAERLQSYTIFSWCLACIIFVAVVTQLPKAPIIEEDSRRIAIERYYGKAVGALRIKYSDTLIQDTAFDDHVVSMLCADIPTMRIGDTRYSLRCSMDAPGAVSIRLVHGDRLVLAGRWDIPTAE